MNIIHIYHKDWDEECKCENNKIIRKNNDEGIIVLKNYYLTIKWDKYENTDCFFSVDGINYYQNIDKFTIYLFGQFSYFYIIDKNISKLYFCDQQNNILYDVNNYEIYYKYEYEYEYKYEYENLKNINNNYEILLLHYFDKIDKKYILLNHNYIEYNYYNELYEIINIEDTDHNINHNLNDNNKCKNIICCKNKGVYFEENNINKIIGTYKKYNNYLKLITNKQEYYYKNNNNNIFKLHKNNYLEIKYINHFHDNTINHFERDTILFIIDNELISIKDFARIIEYYILNSIQYIIIDNIKNNINNRFFFDFNIYYYDELKNNDKNILGNIKLKYKKNIYLEKIFTDHYKITSYLDNDINFFFEKNSQKNSQKNIPKIFHFIWIGKNSIPESYIHYIQSWIFYHQDWTFYFWNDNNIPLIFNQKLYDNSTVYAQKADILRYEILYKYGGIYIDCDFLCVKPIDDLIINMDGFSAYESKEYIAIGIMGFKKKDIFLKKIIQFIHYNTILNNDKTIPIQTGPVFFTKMCNNFIINNKKISEKYTFYSPEYFYNYTYSDKINNNPILFNKNNYAFHLWGYSWDTNKMFQKSKYNYIYPFQLNNLLLNTNDNNDNNDNIVSYNINKNILLDSSNKNRYKIIHIMGIFFSGGIEKFIYYFNKYGNHDKYEYILLCNNKNNINISSIFKNIQFYTYQNNDDIKYLIKYIKPDLIIDHYSIYLDDSPFDYNSINNNIIQIIHSAILYNKNIDKLNFKNCIHLYKEDNKKKDSSWLNIKNNFIISLGTETIEVAILEKYKSINYTNIKNTNNCNRKKIHISIIGRVVPEKIPILFFEKLCILSNLINDIVSIHIYGEKANFFNDNDEYNLLFDNYIKESCITYHDYISYDKIHEIYQITDLLLIPSVYETGSFTCLEAFSYGIPVIARNNYGLSKLIKNNITGYLVENDEEFIYKLKNIKKDTIFDNYYFILKESYKYNIVQKINEYEKVFEKLLSTKNIIIITSVLNITQIPLSYYHIRSVFSIEERFQQTLNTIKTIKDKMGDNIEILFCECSDLLLYPNYIKILEKEVSYFYNFYDNFEVRNNVLSKYKGLGELYLMKMGLNKIIELDKPYQYIFKISGRYFLNDAFHIQDFNNNYNIMTYWDNHIESYSSIFYKIRYQDLLLFTDALKKFGYDLGHGNSFEQCLYKFFKHNILVLNKLNISGHLSTEGYLISI